MERCFSDRGNYDFGNRHCPIGGTGEGGEGVNKFQFHSHIVLWIFPLQIAC